MRNYIAAYLVLIILYILFSPLSLRGMEHQKSANITRSLLAERTPACEMPRELLNAILNDNPNKLLPKNPNNKISYKKPELIVEALQAEAVFTKASDQKPIVATYGCAPCIAVGGYNPAARVAFVIHFATPHEVEQCGDRLLNKIVELIGVHLHTPTYIYLRGGQLKYKISPKTFNAVQQWIKRRPDLSMQIVENNVFAAHGDCGASIMIDARTGAVSDYYLVLNPYARELTQADLDHAWQSSTANPSIRIAYEPLANVRIAAAAAARPVSQIKYVDTVWGNLPLIMIQFVYWCLENQATVKRLTRIEGQ